MLGRLGESPIMGNRGLQINPVGVLASCGLGLNLVWCTLMGHTLGFMSSTAGMDAWANPRLFFLAGILLCTAAFATAPRALKRADGMLRFVLPLLSAFGTACFGMSFHQTFFDPGALAVGGLFVAGVGYFWLAARYMLLLARTQGYVCAVASIAGSLVLKLPVLLVLSAFASPAVQVIVAIAMPVATALLFERHALLRAIVPISRQGRRFGCRCAFEGGFRLGGLSRSYGVRRAGRPAHARAHVSCRTPHHARAVGYCGGGAGCYPLGELPGDVGRYEREHLHGAAVAHRHDRSGRLRRGVRLRRARAPGRCRVADPIPACAAAHLGGFVRRSHPGEPHGSVARVPHRGHTDRRAVRAPLVLDRRGNGARRARRAVRTAGPMGVGPAWSSAGASIAGCCCWDARPSWTRCS